MISLDVNLQHALLRKNYFFFYFDTFINNIINVFHIKTILDIHRSTETVPLDSRTVVGPQKSI